MKIIQENSNLMVIRDTMIGHFLIGAFFAISGFAVAFSKITFQEQPPLWFNMIFIITGLVVCFASKITTITIDKNANRLSFIWVSLLGKKYIEYILDKITSIELQQTFSSSNEKSIPIGKLPISVAKQTRLHRLVFILNDGVESEIPLTPTYESPEIIETTKQKHIGQKISQFLTIPFQEKIAG